jgi:putative acetyltransferase
MLELIRFTKANSDFSQLVVSLDNDLDSRYGNLQKEYNAYNTLDSIHNIIIAYLSKKPVACGCYKKYDDEFVEIKRMFVDLNYRGKGIAGTVLIELENWARENGFKYAVLETGIKQPEAIGLYQKNRYQVTENYGQYISNTNSICMKKSLK